ncbi:hypothetical protein ACFVUB_18135 [Streptomyces niveus]|uniref:hypothetical protein n=1 Tax=Streptomyces niveus TaxID=193462 RepID=UPI0036DACE3B
MLTTAAQPRTRFAALAVRARNIVDSGLCPRTSAVPDWLARFEITAFADKKAAQDACRKEKTRSAKYTKAPVPPVSGVESHTYDRNTVGENGLYTTMCLGTVIAEVALAGPNSTLDPATAHSLAQDFAPGSRKAATAS